MQIKSFTDESEANNFARNVLDDNGNRAGVQIQYTDDRYFVFYEATDEEYQDRFIDKMIIGLTNNLFHESVRKSAIDAELSCIDTNHKDFDEIKDRQKNSAKTIAQMEAKIKAMEAWKAVNYSKISQ